MRSALATMILGLGLVLPSAALALPEPAGGATELYLSSADTLAASGLTVTPSSNIHVVTVPTHPSPFLFIPITSADQMTGQIFHEGASVLFEAGSASVNLANFIMDVGAGQVLADVTTSTGVVGPDVGVFDLVDCLSVGGCQGLDGVLTLDGLGANLSAVAADVFDDVFGVGDFTGAPIGVANVHLILATPEPATLGLMLVGVTGLFAFGRRSRD